MSGDLGYFTIPVPDMKRARAFYGGLFGWEFAPDATDAYAHVTNTTPPGGLHRADGPAPRSGSGSRTSSRPWRRSASSAARPTSRRRARRDGAQPAATTRARSSTCGSRQPGSDGAAQPLGPGAQDLPRAARSDREGRLGRADVPVGGKMFAMYTNNHHGDGIVAVWCKAPPGVQEMLVERGSGAVLPAAVRRPQRLDRRRPRPQGRLGRGRRASSKTAIA